MLRPPAVGYGNLLTGSGLIVMRNLHHLLRLSAFCFLMSCLLPALFKAIPSETAVVILGQVFLTYFLITEKQYSTALLNTDPDSAQYNPQDVFASLAFVAFGILSVIQLKEAYVEVTQMVAVCKDFGMLALAVTTGGTMYAAQRLAREPHDGHGEVKGRGKWGSRGLKWTFNTVILASTCVCGIAFFVLFWWPSLLTECHGTAWCSRDLLRLVCGASVVGFPPLLCLCLLSTQASLDFSCNSYYSPANHPLRTSLS